jgi:hypothetical protein
MVSENVGKSQREIYSQRYGVEVLGIEVVEEVRECEIIDRLKVMINKLKISGDPSVDFSLETLSKASFVQLC